MSDKKKPVYKVNVKVTEVLDDINFDMPKTIFGKMNELTKISKGLHKKDKFEREFIQGQIRTLREQCKNMIFKKWRLTVSSKQYFKYLEFDHFPKGSDIKHAKDSLISAIRTKRSENKVNKHERKEILGFVYNTVGGVFIKPNSVTALATQSNPQDRIQRAKKPHEKMKANYIGVELELVASCDRRILEAEFIKAGLAGFVNIRGDGSIRCEESGQHAHEVTVLCRQDDVKSIITSVCKVLNGKTVKAFVNNSCGLHVHIDSRNRDPEMLFHNMVSVLPMLKGMVPKCRVEGSHANNYCAMNITKDIKSKDCASSNGRRYQAVNPESFSKYKTIELRLHSGSTNATKIINWVTILATVADMTTRLDKDIKSAREFGAMFPTISSKLLSYIEKRTDTFKTEDPAKVDTRGDHFWLNEYELAI